LVFIFLAITQYMENLFGSSILDNCDFFVCHETETNIMSLSGLADLNLSTS